jgi:hypothetical protein
MPFSAGRAAGCERKIPRFSLNAGPGYNGGQSLSIEGVIAALQDAAADGQIRSSAARTLEQIDTPEALAAVEAWRREQN